MSLTRPQQDPQRKVQRERLSIATQIACAIYSNTDTRSASPERVADTADKCARELQRLAAWPEGGAL